MVKTWKFAVTTPEGVYNGELTGEQEPGETNEHAMQAVSTLVQNYMKTYQNTSKILACFVSDGALHIEAPNTTFFTLDIEEEFTTEPGQE